MLKVFTLSAYETCARDFFETLREQKTDLVLDVRLKNTNQLCGFTKRKDLEYLVPALTKAKYVHDLRFAPDEALLSRYLSHWCTWEDYRDAYQKKLREEHLPAAFQETYGQYHSICILGTATKNRRSHSEALAEILTARKK